jgi:hypothetical protein
LVEKSFFAHGCFSGNFGVVLIHNASKWLPQHQEFFDFSSNIYFPGFHFAAQPGPGENPVAVGRTRGNAQDFGRLIAGQPREKAQLDQPGLEWVALGEFGQGRVQSEDVIVRLWRGDEVRMQFLALSFAAVDLATLLAGAFDQDTPHGRRRRREEMAPPAPAPLRVVSNQPQVRFVDQRRRLESLPRLLAGESPP